MLASLCGLVAIIASIIMINQATMCICDDDDALWFIMKWPIGLPDGFMTAACVLLTWSVPSAVAYHTAFYIGLATFVTCAVFTGIVLSFLFPMLIQNPIYVLNQQKRYFKDIKELMKRDKEEPAEENPKIEYGFNADETLKTEPKVPTPCEAWPA